MQDTKLISVKKLQVGDVIVAPDELGGGHYHVTDVRHARRCGGLEVTVWIDVDHPDLPSRVTWKQGHPRFGGGDLPYAVIKI